MTKVASADLQHQIDKMLELEIVHARRDVDTVAGVEADMVFRDAAQCVIERLDAKRDELAAVVDRGVDLTIVVRRHPRIVDLQDEPGVGDRQVLDPHRLAERHHHPSRNSGSRSRARGSKGRDAVMEASAASTPWSEAFRFAMSA